MRRFKISMNEHLNALTDVMNIDEESVDKVIKFIEDSNQLFLTGVGKNADLMYKMSKTFNSVSLKSQFIDPVSAVHGDIGGIIPSSSIIASSKSGTTEELVRFLSAVKNLNENHQILLIHCNKNLENADHADHVVYVPAQNEADHLNIVPTVTLCAIEAFLHSVACEIIEKNHFSKKDMSRNHPAGNLGRVCAS